MKDLSIIIVSYNNKDVIKECLDSIKKNNDIGDSVQTILVEQSDTDEIYNWAKESYPWVEVVRAQNKGFGAGNNRGAEIAEGENLLFLNPDTILQEPIAGFAVEKFKNDSKLGLFGVKLIKRDGSFCSSFQMTKPFGVLNKLIYKVCAKKDIFLKNTMYIEGANLFVRGEAFEAAGRFDENLFMYCEEIDLCERIKREGYELGFFKEKRIVHLQGECSDSRLAKMYEKEIESFKYVCEKLGWDFSNIMKRDLIIWKIRTLLGINRENSEEIIRIESAALK